MQGAGLCDGGARGRGDGDEARQPETGDGGQGHDRQVSNYQTSYCRICELSSCQFIYSPKLAPLFVSAEKYFRS